MNRYETWDELLAEWGMTDEETEIFLASEWPRDEKYPRTCGECEGSGELDAYNYCPYCDGDGFLR